LENKFHRKIKNLNVKFMKAQELAKLIKEKYSYIMISSLTLGVVIGLNTNYPGTLLKRYSTEFIFLMIASMGFTMTFSSFISALKDLKGFLFGMFLNFVFAPMLCYITSLIVPDPELKTGIILIGAVPCAGMAMVWTGLLEGDVPLAVVIGTGTMVLAPFFIPLIISYLAGHYVKIKITKIFLDLIYSILLPVIIGMCIREIFKSKINIKNYLPLCPAISAVCAAFLMFIAVNVTTPLILRNSEMLLPLLISSALIFPSLFVLAYISSKRLFNRAKNIALTYACGMKNLPIALGIAIISFSTFTALPIAVGFIFQMSTAVLFYRIFGRW